MSRATQQAQETKTWAIWIRLQQTRTWKFEQRMSKPPTCVIRRLKYESENQNRKQENKAQNTKLELNSKIQTQMYYKLNVNLIKA